MRKFARRGNPSLVNAAPNDPSVRGTNTLFSGIYKADGTSGTVLRLGLTGAFEACVTEPIMDELRDVLERPRSKKFLYGVSSALTPASVTLLVEQIGVGLPCCPSPESRTT